MRVCVHVVVCVWWGKEHSDTNDHNHRVFHIATTTTTTIDMNEPPATHHVKRVGRMQHGRGVDVNGEIRLHRGHGEYKKLEKHWKVGIVRCSRVATLCPVSSLQNQFSRRPDREKYLVPVPACLLRSLWYLR